MWAFWSSLVVWIVQLIELIYQNFEVFRKTRNYSILQKFSHSWKAREDKGFASFSSRQNKHARPNAAKARPKIPWRGTHRR